MRSTRKRAAVALIAVAALGLAAACGTSKSSDNGGSSEPKLDNKALDSVVNASDQKGGTLKMGLGGAWGDSFDPGDTYYGYSWDLGRNYWRTLVMNKTAPGKQGLELVPDIATDLGKSSDGGKTWTYTIQSGLKFEDGTPFTSKDIAYAVSRTVDRAVLKQGPSYFADLLNWPASYKGPYKSPKNADISSAIETPDDTTIVFHLKQPFAEFDNLASLPATAPVPAAKDTGAKYTTHPVSTGPYMWKGNVDVATGGTLVRNPNWDASTDPIRKAYVDKVEVNETGQQESIQQQLEADTPEADMAWDTFPPPTTVPGLVAKKDPNLSIGDTSSSNPYVIYNFESPNNNKLMSNLKFRQALSSAINRDNLVQVLGGKEVNTPLTHVVPESIDGSEQYDPYPYDTDKAKSLMKEAGVKGPITLKFLYRNESEGSSKSFQTIQQDLSKVGITVKGVPASNADFYTKYLQVPKEAKSGTWDLSLAGWGSDWYGNAALTFFRPLFYGKPSFPPAGSNFGLYDSAKANGLIDQATAAPDADEANKLWIQADKQVMDDAAFFPITNPKTANYKASHLHGAVYMEAFQQFDPANVWIDKDKQEK